jgi:RimJ/RimL family protein N-acetyltransferase
MTFGSDFSTFPHKEKIRPSMLTITPIEVTPVILALFDLTKPTMPRAFNVLEGVNTGQIVVDDPGRPTWAAVREATYSSLYFGGALDQATVTALVTHFFQFGGLGIGAWPDDPLNLLLPHNPDYDGFTLYFPERSPQVDLRPLIMPLPAGYSLLERDALWFTQSFDYESTLAAFGTVENVMRHTVGVCVVQGDTLVCEAATGAPTHGRIEAGVTTHENHRQRGFASLACARLIELCEARGYSTWWDCAKQNTPSVRLASRLGFQNGREYRYRWWEKR